MNISLILSEGEESPKLTDILTDLVFSVFLVREGSIQFANVCGGGKGVLGLYWFFLLSLFFLLGFF